VTHHITYRLTQNSIELKQIKSLQAQHQKNAVPKNLWASHGFVTAEYTLQFLEEMHLQNPAVIAKHQDKVVGYALVADRTNVGKHPLLDDLFYQIDLLEYNGHSLATVNYTVVGQLCVGHTYSGQGVAQNLYKHYQHCYAARFPYCITDVDRNNPRSLKTHLRAGFQRLHTISYGGASWDIVLWDWHST